MYISQKKHCTVGDIIDAFSSIDLAPASLKRISHILEKEWFLCEERYGGISIIASQLSGLNHFITEKFIPMIMSNWFDDTEDNPRSFLLNYLKKNISEETMASPLFCSSCQNVDEMLSVSIVH